MHVYNPVVRHLLIILLLALQPAMLVESGVCALTMDHGSMACCASACCQDTGIDCSCQTRPSDNSEHTHYPPFPAPERVRIGDVLALAIALPDVACDVAEIRTLASVHALDQANPPAVGQRLSILCLWLT